MDKVLKGKTVLWGAPTYDQVTIGWNEMQRSAGGVFGFNRSRMEVTFGRSGGRIVFRSLDDPDNARSHTADLVIIDEAAFVNPDAYYQVLRPMLMDTNGELFAWSTPNGLNWFYGEWVSAEDREDSAYWQIPTVGADVVDGELIRIPNPLENPNIPWEEIENLFKTMPQRVFAQEILAKFLTGEGAVFRNVRECHTAIRSTTEQHKDHVIVMGVDYAKKDDFTVISIGCATCRAEVDLVRFNEIDYAFQNQRIENLWHAWRVEHGRADSASIGEANLDYLIKAGIPMVGVPTNSYTQKYALIDGLALAFDKIVFRFIADRIAVSEMESYEQTKTDQGRPKFGAPRGMHDDVVIARALMYQAAQHAPSKKKKTKPNPWDRLKDSR